MAVKSLQVLFLGQDNDMPRRLLAYGANEGQLVTTCFLSFLIRTEDKNILFDAGMHYDVATHLKSQGRPINVREEDCLPTRLKEAAGVRNSSPSCFKIGALRDSILGWAVPAAGTEDRAIAIAVTAISAAGNTFFVLCMRTSRVQPP